jgi:hypothetical protein
VLFDLAGRHAARVERDDLVAEVAERGLPLGDDLGIEAGVTVARGLDLDLAEVAANGLGRTAVAAVAGAAALGSVFGIAEMLFCLASTILTGQRQLFLPIGDNYKLGVVLLLPYTGAGRSRG